MEPKALQKTQISQSKHSQSSRLSLKRRGRVIGAAGVAALTHYFHQLNLYYFSLNNEFYLINLFFVF